MKLLYHNGRKTEGKKIKKTQPHKNEKTTIEFIWKYEFTNLFHKMNAVIYVKIT